MLARLIYAVIISALAALGYPAPGSAEKSPCPPLLNNKFTNLKDEAVPLRQFRGRVLLISDRVGNHHS